MQESEVKPNLPTIEYRPITDEEIPAAVRTEETAFGSHADEQDVELHRQWFALGESVAAFDGPDPVGLFVSYPFDMTVPGNSVLTACISNVGVLPTHRRRGILTEMMRRQLTNAYERGLCLSALEAAEARIYGRFGYGIACESIHWTIDRQSADFRRGRQWDGSIRLVTAKYARETFPEIYHRAAVGRAGIVQPPNIQWDEWFDGLPASKRDRPPLFYVEYREHRPEGYAAYRVKNGTATVHHLVSCTDAAYAALWKYCLDIDLTQTIQARRRPTDEPLLWMLHDPRKLKRETSDRTWLRLIDVPKALASRTYAQDDRIVFQVLDRFCPWNDATYELAGSPDGAECKRTAKSPDLVLSADDLAVPYLGGFPFTPLARAGRIEERTPGALLRADAMFAAQLKPWSPMLP